MTGQTLSFMRLRGMLRKEILQIRRDPSSIALALVMPVVLLFIFGYGVSLDAENVPVALVLEDDSPPARDLGARFRLSRYFATDAGKNLPQARDMLDSGRIDAIVRLQSDFASRLALGGRAPVQLIVNGTDANRGRQIQGYVRGVLEGWMRLRRARGEPAALPAVEVAQRVRFNEAAISRNFLVPGLLTLIMTLIGTQLTALVVAREWERGTMEALLVTPLRRVELLLGKILPYFLLGMLGMGLSVAIGVTLFRVPFRGSFGALLLLSALFMLAALGFGLLISAAIRIQFVAAQVSIITGFLPAFFLSGLLFDLESTPRIVQMLSYLVPARYFVAISHTLFLAGNLWPVLWPNALALAIMATLFIGFAYRKIGKRLEASRT